MNPGPTDPLWPLDAPQPPRRRSRLWWWVWRLNPWRLAMIVFLTSIVWLVMKFGNHYGK